LLVFATVTVCAALVVPLNCEGKVRLAGVMLGGGAVAVPESPTVCGEPVALSLMLSVPVRLPVLVGTKVTLMRQLAPGATLLPQALEAAKLLVADTEEMLTAAVPVLVS